MDKYSESEINSKFRLWIDSLDLTKTEFALKLDITRQHIYRMLEEQAFTGPTLDKLYALWPEYNWKDFFTKPVHSEFAPDSIAYEPMESYEAMKKPVNLQHSLLQEQIKMNQLLRELILILKPELQK